MDNLFSVRGAAELLEVDRQTVVRALRHTPPDHGATLAYVNDFLGYAGACAEAIETFDESQ